MLHSDLQLAIQTIKNTGSSKFILNYCHGNYRITKV